MTIHFDFIDNNLEIEDDKVLCIECENRNYFYRIVNSLNNISKGIIDEHILFFNKTKEESLLNKIELYIDFFNIEFDNKKYQQKLLSILKDKMTDEYTNKINITINKINKLIKNKVCEIDLPVMIDEIDIDKIYKLIKLNIKTTDSILNNLFLIIDIEKIFRINKILFLINVKQYLSNEELIELYKYAIYNSITIILIDSQSYGVTLEYEKKLIIDNDLDEFVL